jgi:DnaJ-class molecular chaperone
MSDRFLPLQKCPVCLGEGITLEARPTFDLIGTDFTCPVCKGKGVIPMFEQADVTNENQSAEKQ